jgi:hypothetical protein
MRMKRKKEPQNQGGALTCWCCFLPPSWRWCPWCSASSCNPPSLNPSPTLNPCIWAAKSDADALLLLLRLCKPVSCNPPPIGAGLACLAGAPTEGGPERVLAGEGIPRVPRGLGVAVFERGAGAGDSMRWSAAASCSRDGVSSSRLALREWL